MYREKMRALLLLVSIPMGLNGCGDSGSQAKDGEAQLSAADHWPALAPAVEPSTALENRIAELLRGMSLEEKVGQIIQGEIKYVSPEDVRQYHLGAVLNGGGTAPNNDRNASAADWMALADRYYEASIDTADGGSAIPVLWGSDAVHGHNNVRAATVFPHNVGLGASRDAALVQRIAEATAREVRATGLDWAFAPTVAVAQDTRWGRSYESYAEEPALVGRLAAGAVRGLQGEVGSDSFLRGQHIVATAKHFVGDGGTERGIDRGDTRLDEADLVALHAQGYISALNAGVQTIMASFNSWNGDKVHGHHYLLTTVLKERMGFDGFVVGDWNGHQQIPGCRVDRCAAAINAGVDMFMVPERWKALYHNTLEQARNGELSLSRLDDAVSRILRVKLRAGLFDGVPPSARQEADAAGELATAEHRALAREAVRKSLVLLKNDDSLLPLSAAQNILVVGDGANSVAKQSGGWTLTWQGTDTERTDFPAAETIYEGIASAAAAAGGEAVLSPAGDVNGTDFSNGAAAEVIIAVYGEDPYAEWHGDVSSIDYQPHDDRDLRMLHALKATGRPIVSVFLSGRPMWVNPELNASDAFVAAWLPGTEGGGVADVLLVPANGAAGYDFSGKLSFSWPRFVTQNVLNEYQPEFDPLFPYGYGLNYANGANRLPTLHENAETSGNGELHDESLFVYRVVKPWRLHLQSDGGPAVEVTSNRASSGTDNRLTVASIDKDTQEDARQVAWSGGGKASLVFSAQQSQDLSQYLAQNASLLMDLRVDRAPSEPVTLAAQCGEQCEGSLDVTELLAGLPPTPAWSEVSVDLRCLAEAGTDFGRVSAAMILRTRGELELSIANLRIAPGAADVAPQPCPGAEETR